MGDKAPEMTTRRTNIKNWALRIIFCAALLVLGYKLRHHALPRFPCSTSVDRAVLDRSIELGKNFLIQSQTSAGNFRYFYDWRNPDRSAPEGDNQVRQAGTLWGLALLYQDTPSVDLAYAVENGLAFFRAHSRLLNETTRMPVYPDQEKGSTGTVALIVLAYVDYLRSAEHALAPEATAILRTELSQYLNFLISLERADGLWSGNYSLSSGKGFGSPSPYADGESLLAYVKAARYAGKEDLKSRLHKLADAGIKTYIRHTLEKQTLSDQTKGYYQWSSMALFELAESGWENTQQFADIVIRLAHWMIDVHKTLSRTKNTAYAYEGIIHAFVLAQKTGDRAAAEKFLCTSEKGLEKLSGLQLGNPLQNDFISQHIGENSEGLGGVQNSADSPELRIDVTQHQMHTVILARKYIYSGPLTVQNLGSFRKT